MSNLRPNQGKYSLTSKGTKLAGLISEEQKKVHKEIDEGVESWQQGSVFPSRTHPLYPYWLHLNDLDKALFVADYGAEIGSEGVENALYELIEGGYVVENR